MEARIDYMKAAPALVKAFGGVEVAVRNGPLEKTLIELVKMRASQINGCAFCLDMHSKDARKAGETEQRLYTLSAWRETPFFTDRERAALAWCEALTDISRHHISDQFYEETRKHFSEEELTYLTLAIVMINGWNRIAIPFAAVPGSYQPK
jgi:AhpD family alkylhydroperoxidase